MQQTLGLPWRRCPPAPGGWHRTALLGVLRGPPAPRHRIVTTALGLEAAVAEADLVIVGEAARCQTCTARGAAEVARIARRHGKNR